MGDGRGVPAFEQRRPAAVRWFRVRGRPVVTRACGISWGFVERSAFRHQGVRVRCVCVCVEERGRCRASDRVTREDECKPRTHAAEFVSTRPQTFEHKLLSFLGGVGEERDPGSCSKKGRRCGGGGSAVVRFAEGGGGANVAFIADLLFKVAVFHRCATCRGIV